MSERRKRDRYNETWTKDELTESLKNVDKDRKSSHRGEKSRHHRSENDDSGRKERRRREERDEAKPSSSRRHDSRERDKDDRERKREHRSRREESSKNDDRHERRKKHDKDDYKGVNGDDRHHRNKNSRDTDERKERDRKSNRPDKHGRTYEDEGRREDRDRERRKPSSREAKYEDEERAHRKREKERREKKERHRDEEYNTKEHKEDRKKRHDRERKSRHENEDDHERRSEKEREYEHRKRRDDRDEERRDRDSRHGKKEHRSDKHLKKYRDDEHEKRREDNGDSKRDKHKEGKSHRESSRRDRPEEESSSTSSKSRHERNTTFTVEDKNKDEDEYNYDDDEFEDYADDFEDDDDTEFDVVEKKKHSPEMDELMRAIAAENERANSAHSSGHFRSTVTSDRNDSPFSQTSSNDDVYQGPTTVINFSTAKKSSASSKAKKRMLKRSKDLANLIQLDSVSFDILEMAPVTEYSLYIKNYGNSNMKQVSVQCNEDNLDQDIQTEIPDMEDKWSQHPPHDIKCSGGGKVTENNIEDEDRDRLLSAMRNDSIRLTKFMSHASKLVEAILNEDEMWRLSSVETKQKSKLSFCEGYVPLQTNLAYLQGRSAVHMSSSQVASHNLVAVAFNPAANSFSTRIDRKGLVAVWNTKKSAIPEKILVCDACPTYCAFASLKSYILFVGTDDGCVLAYDLREPGVHHQIVSLEATRETVLRSATYTTGYLEDGHSSPIVSILSVGAGSNAGEENQIIPTNLDRKNHSGLAFQLASLEEAARLCIWIVVEMLPESELDDDMGLSPHGKIKLIRSLNFKIQPPVKSVMPELQFRTTCVQFSFIDPNNFYVGTDTGHVVHCTQYSAVSEAQRNNTIKSKVVFFNEIEAVSPVTSLDINPFQLFGSSLILAGYEDGSLRLYLSDRELPVISWPFSTEGASIIKVQWSSTRPSVFFILDSANSLHIWDLAIMHSAAIKTEQCQDKPIRLFSLSSSSPTQNPEISLCYEETTGNDKSMVEVHRLAPHFSQVTDNQELEQLTFLLQSLL